MAVYSREALRAYTAYGKLVPSLPEAITTPGPGWAAQLSATGLLMQYALHKDEKPSGAWI